MLINTILKSEFNTMWSSYLVMYATVLNNLVTKQRNEEYSTGTSNTHYNLILFHSSFILLYLVSVEFHLGINNKKSYYYDKYNLDCLSTKLSCIGVSIKNVLTMLEVDLLEDTSTESVIIESITTPGIGYTSISDNFIIGNNITNLEKIKYPIAIADLYTIPKTCFNVFTS